VRWQKQLQWCEDYMTCSGSSRPSLHDSSGSGRNIVGRDGAGGGIMCPFGFVWWLTLHFWWCSWTDGDGRVVSMVVRCYHKAMVVCGSG
jgi:hypothetical protein